MKIYLNTGEGIDDGRVPRTRRDIDGWYRGDTIHDKHPAKYPTWRVIIGIVLLCLLIIWLCTPTPATCDAECRKARVSASSALTLVKEK